MCRAGVWAASGQPGVSGGAGQRAPRRPGGLSPRKTPRRLELTAWRRARRGDRTAAVMPGGELYRTPPRHRPPPPMKYPGPEASARALLRRRSGSPRKRAEPKRVLPTPAADFVASSRVCSSEATDDDRDDLTELRQARQHRRRLVRRGCQLDHVAVVKRLDRARVLTRNVRVDFSRGVAGDR
jgi:hypothetical protein